MRGPSPVKSPLLICAIFALALYLAAQYAVNQTTFNDACRDDVRWASVLNYFNLLTAAVLFAFAAMSVYTLASEAKLGSLGGQTPDASSSSASSSSGSADVSASP